MMRSLLTFSAIKVLNERTLLRALELYEAKLDFAKAYLVACAELTGVGKIASFNRTIDQIDSVQRVFS